MSSTPVTRTTSGLTNVTITTPGTESLFVLTPGQVNAETIIQMDTKAGREVYNKFIQPLKIPFDGDSKTSTHFRVDFNEELKYVDGTKTQETLSSSKITKKTCVTSSSSMAA